MIAEEKLSERGAVTRSNVHMPEPPRPADDPDARRRLLRLAEPRSDRLFSVPFGPVRADSRRLPHPKRPRFRQVLERGGFPTRSPADISTERRGRRQGTAALQDALAAGGRWCALLLLFAGFSARAALNVVATTPDIGSIGEAVGGTDIKLTTLARPAEDPHFVDPKPSFIVKLNRADVLLHGGADLESGWLPPLLAGTRNGKIAPGSPGNVPCNKAITMLEVPTALDRAQGDIHGRGNPHYLVDPGNAIILARHLADVFGQLDEAHAEAYRARAAQFGAQLEARLKEWEQKLAPFKGSQVVAYHNSWPYFARRFGLRIEVFLEPKPGIPPSPAHMAAVISTMREQNIGVVFVDPYLSRKTAETAADATGARIVPVTQYPGGVKGSEGGYIAMMNYLVHAVAGAFETTAASQ